MNEDLTLEIEALRESVRKLQAELVGLDSEWHRIMLDLKGRVRKLEEKIDD